MSQLGEQIRSTIFEGVHGRWISVLGLSTTKQGNNNKEDQVKNNNMESNRKEGGAVMAGKGTEKMW